MDFLDIVKATFFRAGANIELTEEAKKINNLLKEKNKTVFILIDGMGALLIKNLISNSFLDKNIREVATTVLPSTTSVVLTSLTTGKYPAEHSMNGWFNYIEETDESIISLPFITRFNAEEPVKVGFYDVFFGETLFNKVGTSVSVITKTDISKSDYSKWFRGNSKVYTYRTLKGAFQTLSKIITKDNEKELIYLYIDDFDSLCHKYGPDSEEAKNLLKKINEHIEKFARIHSHKVNAIITADHGQVPIKNENFFVINNEDKIMELLKAPPSGDSRFVCFHVKKGKEEEFKQFFNRQYGEYARLFSQEELNKLHLLGPDEMTEKAKSRYGDYCAIFNEGYAFSYQNGEINRNKLNKGCHSGDTDEEMKIPLILIN